MLALKVSGSSIDEEAEIFPKAVRRVSFRVPEARLGSFDEFNT